MKFLIKCILLSLILAGLVYPGFEKLYLYAQKNKLDDVILGPFSFLGENQTILSNYDRFTRYGISYKELSLLGNRDLSIGIKSEFLSHGKWVNIEKERARVSLDRLVQLKNNIKRLANGEYSMIAYGPDETSLDLFWLVQFNQFFRENSPDKIKYINLDDYCEVYLPSTEHSCNECKNELRVFFKENETCNKFVPKIRDYYNKNLYKICRTDQVTANVNLRVMLLTNGLFVNATCKEGGKLLIRYNNKSFGYIPLINVIYLSAILSALLLFAEGKKKKISFILMMSILVLSFIIVDELNYGYFKNYYVNETAYIDPTFFNAYQSIKTEDYFPDNTNAIKLIKPDVKIATPRYTPFNISIRSDLIDPNIDGVN